MKNCVFGLLVVTTVLVLPLFASRGGAAHGGKEVDARFYMGSRRAPLPFPFQLVHFEYRSLLLCNYEGDVPVTDVEDIGYDYRYIYARDRKDRFYLLHLYDAYVEEYDGEQYLPESIRTRLRDGTVKMMGPKGYVDSFQANALPIVRSMRRREEWLEPSEESHFFFLDFPSDVTVSCAAVSNNTPLRVMQRFQNVDLIPLSISRIECKGLDGIPVTWRNIGNERSSPHREWREVAKMTGPQVVMPQENIEVCIEFSKKQLFPTGYRHGGRLPMVIMHNQDGERLTLRICPISAER